MYSDNEVSISSKANWIKSQSNCKDPNYMEHSATDLCEVNKDITTETGMWTNTFRVDISSHIDQSNVFYNNT